MQSCVNCGATLKYSQVLKSIGWFYHPVTCKQCGQVHNITFLSRFIVAFLITLPMAIFMFADFKAIHRIGYYFLTAYIIFTLLPYFLKYKR